MAVLDQLEPKAVFRFFEELCSIPHGSHNTRQVSGWLAAFARERGLRYTQDALGNVILFGPASPGYEAAEPVILQGHMDMVCVSTPDCTRDLATEGLDLAVEGDTVYARGSSLGGDDGIAVAMILALLDDKTLPHPAIEAVITVDEEVGMDGAMAIDVSALRSRRMINIDSEDEGVFTVSCAGGCVARCSLPVTRAAAEGETLRIALRGLTCGHSGTEIDKRRASATQCIGRVLNALADAAPFLLVSVSGGEKDNAIATEAAATLVTGAARGVFRNGPGAFAHGGARRARGDADGRGEHGARAGPAALPALRRAGDERRHSRSRGDLAEPRHSAH